MKQLIKVRKNIARQAYENGSTVILNPCNLRVNGVWSTSAEFNNKEYEVAFNSLVDTFEYYNCTNKETGKRAAYYLNAECASFLKPHQYEIVR